jgi:hypothetical protein
MLRSIALCLLALSAACGETPVEPVDTLAAQSFDASLAANAVLLDLLPGTPEELVCGFVADLDQLSEEAGLAGDFDDDRLNRALDHARSSITEAREAATVPDLPHSFRALKAAMRELEKGDAVPVSGHGFADDLASLGSYFGEVFTGSLINLASQLGSVPEGVMDQSVADFEDGVVERGLGEWERGVAAFGKAVSRLDSELDIGPPCSEATP